jgi:hypothetical protein
MTEPSAEEYAARKWHERERSKNSHSVVYESSRVVAAGPSWLYGFTVRTSRTSAQFILLFDQADANFPSSAVPDFPWDIGAAPQTLGVSYGALGRFCERGIILANSTTATTLTAGSADCWFDVQYLPAY